MRIRDRLPAQNFAADLAKGVPGLSPRSAGKRSEVDTRAPRLLRAPPTACPGPGPRARSGSTLGPGDAGAQLPNLFGLQRTLIPPNDNPRPPPCTEFRRGSCQTRPGVVSRTFSNVDNTRVGRPKIRSRRKCPIRAKNARSVPSGPFRGPGPFRGIPPGPQGPQGAQGAPGGPWAPMGPHGAPGPLRGPR